MTTKNANTSSEAPGISMTEIYMEFLDNMRERFDGNVGQLTDKMANATDPETILAYQKELIFQHEQAYVSRKYVLTHEKNFRVTNGDFVEPYDR